MRSLVRRIPLVAMVVTVALFPAFGQFGKNKIQYDKFQWKVYQAPHFDVHYYGAGENFLEEIVSYAESAYVKISKDLDHELRTRTPLVIYNTHAEFEQTNIVLQEIPEAVGAFAEAIQNRMVLPIDLPPDDLYELIAHELTHIFEYSILFEGNIGRAIRSNPPLWFMEGLASYLAHDEDSLDQMAIRDAVVNNILPPVQALTTLSFLTYRYGHAVFDFIEQEHGVEGLRSFIFEYRKVLLTNNLGKAVKEAFGYDIGEFNRRFNRYLRRKYFPVLLEKKSPDDYGTEIGIKKPGVFTFSPTISPSGELVATLSTPTRLDLDLVVLSANGEKVRNVTKGWTNRYQNLVAESFSGRRDLSWSPASDLVAVFARKEGKRRLLIYDALSGKMKHNIQLPGIAECSSPAFSPDGARLAFEGNQEGVVDIFEIDLETREIRNLTQDGFFDANPWYAPDGKSLLYNRRIGSYWKIFSVDMEDATRKTQLSFGPSHDIQPAYSRDASRIYFSSDRSPYRVFNIHAVDLNTGEITQHTDVVGGCFSPAELAERDGEPYIAFVAFFEGTFRLYRMPVLGSDTTLQAKDQQENLGEDPQDTPAEDPQEPPVEVEPFEPPLRLTVDEDKKTDYKVKYSLERPGVTVGLTDDGTFLSNIALEFTDLLGDRRIQVLATTVSNFANLSGTFLNLKKRYNWGVTVFDFRDYYAVNVSNRDQIERVSGVSAFLQYPMSRYYRVTLSGGYSDRSSDFLVFNPITGQTEFFEINERLAISNVALTGDTTRYQSFGPFQGKRFNLGVLFGKNVGGDPLDDILQYNLDFRAYKQATRRSVLAWRLAGIYNAQQETFYAIGGLNQLRGYTFREFVGSNIAWSNLEFRFPLAEQIAFPILSLVQIRGFLFLDVATAWFGNETWWDPSLRSIRIDVTGRAVPFKFWDSDNDRLQDGRASYGLGFHFLFLGGLQFNWAWAKRVEHTGFARDPLTGLAALDPLTGEPIKIKVKDSKTRMDFYIIYDW